MIRAKSTCRAVVALCVLTAWAIGEFENSGTRSFTPPDKGELLDWILVLDDVSKSYPNHAAARRAARAGGDDQGARARGGVHVDRFGRGRTLHRRDRTLYRTGGVRRSTEAGRR